MSGWKYELDICKFVQEAHRSKQLKVMLDSLSLDIFTVVHLDHSVQTWKGLKVAGPLS